MPHTQAPHPLHHDAFPRSDEYDPGWLLEGAFGAHPLWLTEWLTDALPLAPGMRVLDLGCGRAKSSIFLAREFDVEVWATDLWVSPTENHQRIRDAGLQHRVFPLHSDARALPFAHGFFDAILAVDSYQYFGTDDLTLGSLLRFLRPGGLLGMASAGLMQRFTGPIPEHLQRFWQQDCWCLHTVAWWRHHWERTGLVAIEHADTMPDGWRAWLQWAKAGDCSAWYLDTLEADAGCHLGYIRLVARSTVQGPVFSYDLKTGQPTPDA